MKATDIGKYLWRIFVILLLNILVIVMVSGYEPFASFASQDASEDSAQEVLSKYGRIQDNPRTKLLAAVFLECCHLFIRNPAALKDLPYF